MVGDGGSWWFIVVVGDGWWWLVVVGLLGRLVVDWSLVCGCWLVDGARTVPQTAWAGSRSTASLPPEDVNRAQHRITSTNQHQIGMGTQYGG